MGGFELGEFGGFPGVVGCHAHGSPGLDESASSTNHPWVDMKGLTLQVSTSSYPVCPKVQGREYRLYPNRSIQRTLAKKMNIVRVRCRVKIMAK